MKKKRKKNKAKEAKCKLVKLKDLLPTSNMTASLLHLSLLEKELKKKHPGLTLDFITECALKASKAADICTGVTNDEVIDVSDDVIDVSVEDFGMIDVSDDVIDVSVEDFGIDALCKLFGKLVFGPDPLVPTMGSAFSSDVTGDGPTTTIPTTLSLYSAGQLNNLIGFTSTEDLPDNCPICLTSVTLPESIVLTCGHYLHKECLELNIAAVPDCACPTCKTEIEVLMIGGEFAAPTAPATAIDTAPATDGAAPAFASAPTFEEWKEMPLFASYSLARAYQAGHNTMVHRNGIPTWVNGNSSYYLIYRAYIVREIGVGSFNFAAATVPASTEDETDDDTTSDDDATSDDDVDDVDDPAWSPPADYSDSATSDSEAEAESEPAPA